MYLPWGRVLALALGIIAAGRTASAQWQVEVPVGVTPEAAQQYFADRASRPSPPSTFPGQTASRATIGSTEWQMFLATSGAADITPAIRDLARSLQHDPKAIYDFVHTQIDYEPYYGALKGATATLLDRSGNDCDQAALLIALLRASGRQARFVRALMLMSFNNLGGWLAVSPEKQRLLTALAFAGIPAREVGAEAIEVERILVQASLDEGEQVLDPAFKRYALTTGINLWSALQFDDAAFEAAARAGATVGPDYVQNVNEGAIRDSLTRYAMNLVDTIRRDHPNATVAEVFGGRTLVEPPDDLGRPLASQWSALEQWDEVPLAFTSMFTLRTEGFNLAVPVPRLAARRVSITPFGFTISNDTPGREDLVPPFPLIDSAVTGRPYPLTMAIDKPYAALGGTYRDVSRTTTLVGGTETVLVLGLGFVSRQLLSVRQQALNLARRSGVAASGHEVLGETLNIVGLNWLQQYYFALEGFERFRGVISVDGSGVFGLVSAGTYPVIDLMSVSSALVYQTGAASSDGAGPSYHYSGRDLSTMHFASALEHGVWEQVAGFPSVSTIRGLQIANASGQRIYRIDGRNAASARTLLAAYPEHVFQTIQGAQADPNFFYVLPERGDLTFEQWRGFVYRLNDSRRAGWYIGAANGGYGACRDCKPDPGAPAENTPDVHGPALDINGSPTSQDPVDMLTGHWVFEAVDLSLGTSLPLGLALRRTYSSGMADLAGRLGQGWTHNYDVTARTTSDGALALSGRQPADLVALVTYFYTAQYIESWDLVDQVALSLAAAWLADQTTRSIVTVTRGSRVRQFLRLPDGSYASPPGDPARLVEQADGRITLRERLGPTLEFDTNGKLTSLTDQSGNHLLFDYAGGLATRVRDASGRSFTFAYEGSRLSSVTDSAGRVVRYRYDATGNLVTFLDAEGSAWTYEYDDRHRVVRAFMPAGSGPLETVLNEYDHAGRVIRQTLPRQGGTSAVYRFYFTGWRNVEQDPAGNKTTYFFDRERRHIGTEDALGARTSKAYDGQGHLIEAIDARGNRTRFVYDDRHNVLRTIDALGAQRVNDYDAESRLVRATDSLGGISSFEYDSKHRVVRSTDALGRATIRTHYPSGLVQTSTDPGGVVTHFSYDAAGLLTSVRVGASRTAFAYDHAGLRTKVTDPMGGVTSFTYNGRGQTLTETDPFGKVRRHEYDPAGRRVSITDRNGHRTTTSYTPSGNPDRIAYVDGTFVQFSYDARDFLTAMQDARGTTTYTVDVLGRPVQTTDPHGFRVSVAFDPAGNTRQVTYPGPGIRTVQYSYDALNRIDAVAPWFGQTARYRYDAVGRLTRLEQFNGTVTAYAYDAAGGLIEQSTVAPGGRTVASYRMTYDARGLRTRSDATQPLPNGEADAASTYSYSTPPSRLMLDGARPFTYDDEGRLTQDGLTVVSFDAASRLVGRGTTGYVYDGAGRRLQAVRAGRTTRYAYDGPGNLLIEADGANAPLRYYVHGIELLAAVTPGGEVFSYHFDPSGNTIALTDGAANLVNQYAYGPFGTVTDEVELVAQPFKFVGASGVAAEPDGLYYMRARYYDSSVGRFVSEDPKGFEAGDANLYSYVGNNPIRFVDPMGTSASDRANRLVGSAIRGAQIGVALVSVAAAAGAVTVAAGPLMAVSVTVAFADTLHKAVTGDPGTNVSALLIPVSIVGGSVGYAREISAAAPAFVWSLLDVVEAADLASSVQSPSLGGR